ncbi:HAD-IA family hydrolase [Ciceribacter sp. L1K22]|uniref:HAD family hydrolase n=1 Tax=Ciceribacter sp. L1K22 TaxID=2820275 RepID=UPI001ABE0D13|nr:phosphoglycolate phosphatase [Ciceribacter sp. L1K22]
MTVTTIVFDLDGTLVDTAPDLMHSLNHTIAAVGLAPVGYEDITHLVGQGAKVMIERAFRLREAPLADSELPALLDRFIDHYSAHMPGESLPFPGVVDALDRLTAAGYRLAVCTNKMERLAVPLIANLGLGDRFAAIAGGDTFPTRKPDGAHIVSTVEKAGGDPRRAIMVGDSVNDILAAQNARMPSIAVPFGYSDVPVDTLGADRIISHFDQLTSELVEALLA